MVLCCGSCSTAGAGEARMLDDLLAALIPKRAQFPVVMACIVILLALVGLALFL
jgi:hypothetical protein